MVGVRRVIDDGEIYGGIAIGVAGDVFSGGRIFGRGRSDLLRRWSAGSGFEKRFQVCDESLRLIFASGAAAKIADHLAKLIERGEQHVHNVARNLALAFAKNIEHIFGVVSELDDVVIAEETGSALDGVKGAKNAIEQLGIFGSGFEGDEILIQLLQEFLTFGEVILEQLGVLFDLLAHRYPGSFRYRCGPCGIYRQKSKHLRRYGQQFADCPIRARASRSA